MKAIRQCVVTALLLNACSKPVSPPAQVAAAEASNPVTQLLAQIEQDKRDGVNFSEKSRAILDGILWRSNLENATELAGLFQQSMNEVKRNEPKTPNDPFSIIDGEFKSDDFSTHGAALIASKIDAQQYVGSYFGVCILISATDITMYSPYNCLLIAGHDIKVNSAEKSMLVALNKVTIKEARGQRGSIKVVAKESILPEEQSAVINSTVDAFFNAASAAKGASLETLSEFLAKESKGLVQGKESDCNSERPDACRDTLLFSDGTQLVSYRSNENISYILRFADNSYAVVNKEKTAVKSYDRQGMAL